MRNEQGDWEKGKHDERDDDEWFAAVSVGIMRCRNDAQRRGQHFNCRKHANFLRAHADVIHREDHDPGGIRSQNRIRMSLKSSRRIGELNSRKLCQKFRCSFAVSSFGSSRRSRCTKIVAPERTIEITSAMRTPPITPNRSINTPPKNGAIMIGNRLITAWTPMPIEWRFASSAAATSENVAGNEKQLHDKNRNIPAITAAQCGIKRTSA